MAEKKNGRKNGRPTATVEATTNGKGANGHHELGDNALAATVVKDMTRSNTELAKTSLGAETDAPVKARVGFGGSNVAADGSDVTDEASKTAVAFGDFVKNIGMAVAGAQEELDKTLRETAKRLSETKIEVVHTYEQELDNDGRLTNRGEAKMQSLPLINYLMPTAYQWSRVYLEAEMKVNEFNSKSGFDIQSKASSGGFGLRGGFGVGGASFGGFGGFGASSSQTSVQNGFAMDSAAGTMKMEATLEPRGDIELPRPIILQKGPTIQLSSAVTPMMQTPPSTPENPTPQPVMVGREATVTVTVKTHTGQPNANKLVEYSLDQPAINHSAGTGGLTTNAQGVVTINLKREGAAFDRNTAMTVKLVVWLGMVSQTITVNL